MSLQGAFTSFNNHVLDDKVAFASSSVRANEAWLELFVTFCDSITNVKPLHAFAGPRVVSDAAMLPSVANAAYRQDFRWRAF